MRCVLCKDFCATNVFQAEHQMALHMKLDKRYLKQSINRSCFSPFTSSPIGYLGLQVNYRGFVGGRVPGAGKPQPVVCFCAAVAHSAFCHVAVQYGTNHIWPPMSRPLPGWRPGKGRFATQRLRDVLAAIPLKIVDIPLWVFV